MFGRAKTTTAEAARAAGTRLHRFDGGLRLRHIGTEQVLLAHGATRREAARDVLGRLERITRLQAIDGTLFDRGVGRYGNVLLTRDPAIEQNL